MARQYVRRTKYTADYLRPFVEQATCWGDLIRRMGLKPSGGTYRQIQGVVWAASLSTVHFTGQGWNRGKTVDTDERVARTAITQRIPDELVFVENSSYGGARAKERLQKERPYECVECGMGPEWRGKKLTLHLDHINGVHNDNRRENLRFLCPNCHQQTETWGAARFKKSPELRARALKTENTKKQRVTESLSRTALARIKNEQLVDKLKNADVDFQRFGWGREAARVLGMYPQKVCEWMKRWMPEDYAAAFKRPQLR